MPATQLLKDTVFCSLPILALSQLVKPAQPTYPLRANPSLLIIKRDGLGDFVLITPLLRELRRLFPISTICLAVGDNVRELAETCPYIDELKILPKARLSNPNSVHMLWRYVRANFANRFDLAIVPRWDEDRELTTLIARWSAAPRILGFTEKTSIEKSWSNFKFDKIMTDVLPPGAPSHETTRNLGIITYLGGAVHSDDLELWANQEDTEAAVRLLKTDNRRADTGLLIGLGVSASHAKRKWPFYPELVTEIAKVSSPFTPVVLGGPDEIGIANQIAERVPTAILCIGKPLRQVAEALKRCAVFIGNDSGLLHMAAAAGRPHVIEISCHPRSGDPDHKNSPVRFGPHTKRKTVLQPDNLSVHCRSGCEAERAHCINAVSVDSVVEALIDAEPLELKRICERAAQS